MITRCANFAQEEGVTQETIEAFVEREQNNGNLPRATAPADAKARCSFLRLFYFMHSVGKTACIASITINNAIKLYLPLIFIAFLKILATSG